MLFLLGGQDKKSKKNETKTVEKHDRVRDLFLNGKFPVVTTDLVEGKKIAKVLGLVCCRGYDSEEAFFGMASRAVNKGAHAIVGYCENIAFHPDGSKFFSCFGTAVMFEWEADERFGAAALREAPLHMRANNQKQQTPRAVVAVTNEDDFVDSAPRAADPEAGEREMARLQRNAASKREQPSRLSKTVDDDFDLDDLPPLKPLKSTPSWQRA